MSSKENLENIKKLREITGVGFKDCKLAIDENNGDIEKSIEYLRIKGIAKASKKMGRVAADGLVLIYEKNNNIDLTISSAKPPIFWKDKEITKQQIFKWKPNNIKNLIFQIDKIELMVKKNYENSVNLVTDFILEQCSSRN